MPDKIDNNPHGYMAEILHIQIGKCGIKLGNCLWERFYFEHGVNNTSEYCGYFEGDEFQLSGLSTFWKELPSGRYIPRAILADLDEESNSTDNIRWFQSSNCIIGNGHGTGNNWAKGYFTEGLEQLDSVLEAVRTEIESCDCLQGFQFTHSIGGGTGSGLGSLLISQICEEYPDRMMSTFTVVPSHKVSQVAVESYNAVLTLRYLMEYADQCFILDNEALHDILWHSLRMRTPLVRDLNQVAADVMSDVTCHWRFEDQMFNNMHKFYKSMIHKSAPRLHFLMIGLAPIVFRGYCTRSQLVDEAISGAFQPTNLTCATNPRSGRYLACNCMFRGRVKNCDIHNWFANTCNRRDLPALSGVQLWENFQYSCSNLNRRGVNLNVTTILNSTSIRHVWQRLLDEFNYKLKRKAFLHCYTGEGMEESEFTEAHDQLGALISEYLAKECVETEDDEEADEGSND